MKLLRVFIVLLFFQSNVIIGQENSTQEKPSPPPCSQDISGTVKNRITNEYIKNATVELYLGNTLVESQLTNQKGQYKFKVECRSSYLLVASKDNYSNSKKEFTTSNVGSIKVIFSLYLESVKMVCDQIVRGRIINSKTNEPIKDVTVLINDVNGNTLKTDLTNIYGNYHFNLPCNKQFKIVLSKENFVTHSEDFKTNKTPNNLQRIDVKLTSNKTCERNLSGTIVDSKTLLPIENAVIEIVKGKLNFSKSDSDINGKFIIPISCDSYVEFKASYPKYKISTIPISNITSNSKTNELLVKLTPISNNIVDTIPKIETEIYKDSVFVPKVVKGLKVDMKNNRISKINTSNLEFDLNMSTINRKTAIELNKMVAIMHQSKEMSIVIKSHTDSRGPDQYNLDLTEQRAQSIASYITAKGIDSSRIKAKGYGETELLNNCPNKAKCKDSEHELNKRIEIIITN